MKRVRFLLLALLMSLSATASVEVHEFDTAAERERYRHLIEELRCLVCQNQNLAESDADLAKDLRQQVYEQIESGRSNDEIVDFMVARYGEFVLYRPPLTPTTVLLWVGPFVILAAGIAVLLVHVRRRRAAPAAASEDELARARHLLDSSESSDNP